MAILAYDHNMIGAPELLIPNETVINPCRPNYDDPFFAQATRVYGFNDPYRLHSLKAGTDGTLLPAASMSNGYLSCTKAGGHNARFPATDVEGWNTGAVSCSVRVNVSELSALIFSVCDVSESLRRAILIVGHAASAWPDESVSFFLLNGSTVVGVALTKGHTWLLDGQWHQIYYVVDGVNTRFIVDGVMYDEAGGNVSFSHGSKTTQAFTEVSATPDYLFLGSQEVGSTVYPSNIDIREMMFFVNPPSDAEVIAHQRGINHWLQAI